MILLTITVLPVAMIQTSGPAAAQAPDGGPGSSASTVLFKTLMDFGYNNGARPNGGLIQATDGNFYGTTNTGGLYRKGAAFKMTPTGGSTLLYSFCTESLCPFGGVTPDSGVIQGTDGNFYGTTSRGGTDGTVNLGGVVYQMTPTGAVTVLHSFCSDTDCSDGSGPVAGLVEGVDGNFYGTTTGGGLKTCTYGCGTAFSITPQGTLTTMYDFCQQANCTDGAVPYSGLIQGVDGNFYGTASGGTYGAGLVFKLTPEGNLTGLYSFCAQTNCTDGQNPGGLIQATNGNLYGTTSGGGAHDRGTVFELTLQGSPTTLYSFCGQNNCTDGESPNGLIQASDGNFYGITTYGGGYGYGTVFELTPNGVLTTLHAFCSQSGCPDGYDPTGLTQRTDGSFYGTTFLGGAKDDGTAFALDTGLAPFVETQTSSGKAGWPVTILGTSLSGASGVTFNGTAAQFTVVSSSEITTAVPVGATTGLVVVSTPAGTLKSNRTFRVVP